ncbi:unnamed protein product [Pleuronectes platessa]|uniref:Uncharacterized protein n=1 Tax=Pleuronectes platessa TaxID=8262 RepID=A0A9N7TPF1_PLEPL|nr:unnamed protein product [Pleuronectes platessa]
MSSVWARLRSHGTHTAALVTHLHRPTFNNCQLCVTLNSSSPLVWLFLFDRKRPVTRWRGRAHGLQDGVRMARPEFPPSTRRISLQTPRPLPARTRPLLNRPLKSLRVFASPDTKRDPCDVIARAHVSLCPEGVQLRLVTAEGFELERSHLPAPQTLTPPFTSVTPLIKGQGPLGVSRRHKDASASLLFSLFPPGLITRKKERRALTGESNATVMLCVIFEHLGLQVYEVACFPRSRLTLSKNHKPRRKERDPFVSPAQGRERGLWGKPPLGSTTPPAIKNTQKEKERKKGTGLPTPAWRPPYPLAAPAHKHRLPRGSTERRFSSTQTHHATSLTCRQLQVLLPCTWLHFNICSSSPVKPGWR